MIKKFFVTSVLGFKVLINLVPVIFQAFDDFIYSFNFSHVLGYILYYRNLGNWRLEEMGDSCLIYKDFLA